MRLAALSLVPHVLLSSVLAAVQVTLPTDIPAKCVASCNTFKNVLSACPAATAECLCTLQVEHIGYACARCVSTKATYPQQQRELDAWLADCKAAGHPLPPLTFPAPGQPATTPLPATTSVPRQTTTSAVSSTPLTTTPGRTLSIPATTRGVGRGATTTPLARLTSTSPRILPTASQVVYRGSAASRRSAVSLVAVVLGALLAVALPRL